MTDRFNSITVILESDIRDDDAQPLIDAIYQMRGVLSVVGNVAELQDYIATERVRRELLEKMHKILYPL